MTDEQAADDLNTAYRSRFISRPAGHLRSVVFQSSKTSMAAIKAESENKSSPIQETALRTWLLMNDREASINFANSAERQSLNNALQTLVDNNLLDSSDKMAMMNLGDQSITRAQELNLLGKSPEIGFGHVRDARAL
jgi:hypothetical protein